MQYDKGSYSNIFYLINDQLKSNENKELIEVN
jgi:hypothetical protein